MTDKFWTADRVELLTALWAEGLATKVIAEKIGGGGTNNAVIGKANRLCLPRHPKANKPSTTPKIIKVKRKYVRKLTRDTGKTRAGFKWVRSKIKRVVLHEPIIVIVDSDIPATQRRTFMKLRAHQCKYPVGDPKASDFFFCGALQKEKSSYCPAHHQRCHMDEPVRDLERMAMGQWGAAA
jgi:GcrA cell cycle regulator